MSNRSPSELPVFVSNDVGADAGAVATLSIARFRSAISTAEPADVTTVHLVNPSHISFGIGVITPRWLFVLAAATPPAFGRPRITEQTLEIFDI